MKLSEIPRCDGCAESVHPCWKCVENANEEAAGRAAVLDARSCDECEPGAPCEYHSGEGRW